MLSIVHEIALTDTGLLPSLVRDYLQGHPDLNRLTTYPYSFDSFEKAIADKQTESIDRNLLSDVLKEQYASIAPSSAVLENIALLKSETTFTVTAAHQPCLFLGPLYNIYKIAAAINTTLQLKEKFPNYDFVPVFWLGSEDHDVEELNHAFVSGVKVEWKECGTGAAGKWKTDTLKAVIEELKKVSPNTAIVSVLEEGLKDHSTFGSFMQYFVHELFKDYGLVVLNQDDARLKKRFAAVMTDEVLNSRATHVLEPTLSYLDAHYKVQARPREINFFYLGDGYRERIVRNETTQRLEVNNKDISFSKAEILEEIQQHPERFSPNVILRPLYQEIILPNLAFTGGAGELSYWLQLKPIFDFYQVNFPLLAHRPSMAIVPASVQKKIEKLGLTYADFFSDTDVIINRYMQQHVSEEQSLKGEQQKLESMFEEILQKAEKADSTLKAAVQAEKQKAMTALQNLENKMLKAEKRKQETAINQIKGVKDVLYPGQVLQERRENFIPHYNSDFISTIVQHADPFKKQFLILSEL